LLVWSVLQSRQSFFKEYTPYEFLFDYVLNVGTFVLIMTLYSSQPVFFYLLLLAPAALVYLIPPAGQKKKPKMPPKTELSQQQASKKLDPLPPKPFLTSYRASMLISTIVAILAVDFRVFPRRFAKVETWGTSLMDLGVGSFVFSAGVVAARPILKDRAAGRSMPTYLRIFYSLRHSLPLLVLGVIRLLSVKGLDYAEHVTEYGVHWNFFFTLGLLPPFVAASRGALLLIPSHATLALLIGFAYQAALETTNLTAYILTAPRVDLISMNREGIFSFIGYLAIFLAGQDLGMFVIPRRINSKSTASAGVERNTLLMTLAVWSAIWCALFAVTTSYNYGFGWSVSRRLANLPYVLGVASFNSLLVLALCTVDTIFFPATYNATDPKTEKEAYLTATSPVLRAYNRNGLALFLAANLLTGLVNMTISTLDTSRRDAVIILMAYTGALTVLARILDMYNISIKL
jgi:phosphatidylinositol glycan class W